MARPHRSRRFDFPRAGVSQAMIEAEATELERELKSHLLWSMTELKANMAKRLEQYRTADEELQTIVSRLVEQPLCPVLCLSTADRQP